MCKKKIENVPLENKKRIAEGLYKPKVILGKITF